MKSKMPVNISPNGRISRAGDVIINSNARMHRGIKLHIGIAGSVAKVILNDRKRAAAKRWFSGKGNVSHV